MAAYPPISFSEPPDSTTLQRKLDSIFAGIRRRDVVVGCSIDGKVAFAGLTDGRVRSDASDRLLRVGCLAKLFAAMLVEQAIASGRLPRNGEVGAYFPQVDSAKALAGVTIRHLLEHTHGLDDSAGYAPRTGDSFIDLESLVAQCSMRRLNRPGEIYSYSNSGAWLLGALLERCFGRRYDEILCSNLLLRSGECLAADAGKSVPDLCPAKGSDLTVILRDLLRLFESVLSWDSFWRDPAGRAAITPLPGWHPFESAVYRGWKCYGNGWYGHSATAKDQRSALVRVNPRRKIVLIIASVRHDANAVVAKLFGKAAPGFSNLTIPRRLSEQEVAEVDLVAYSGNYVNGTEAYSISVSDAKELRLFGKNCDVGLRFAEGRVFLPRNATDVGIGFVQLVRKHGARFRYLWNGQRVYRNREMETRI